MPSVGRPTPPARHHAPPPPSSAVALSPSCRRPRRRHRDRRRRARRLGHQAAAQAAGAGAARRRSRPAVRALRRITFTNHLIDTPASAGPRRCSPARRGGCGRRPTAGSGSSCSPTAATPRSPATAGRSRYRRLANRLRDHAAAAPLREARHPARRTSPTSSARSPSSRERRRRQAVPSNVAGRALHRPLSPKHDGGLTAPPAGVGRGQRDAAARRDLRVGRCQPRARARGDGHQLRPRGRLRPRRAAPTGAKVTASTWAATARLGGPGGHGRGPSRRRSRSASLRP